MPSLAAEITAAVESAYNTRTPLNITGAGTKSFLGQQATNNRSLDVTEHTGIIEYDPAELVMVARAGTPLGEIERVLNENGQMLGFEPPFVDAGATLGGAVAAGLAGPRRAYAGAVRDFILGCNFINGKGESVTAGGKVMKNVAGFDLFRPMARSMGTLGVMLKIALRLLPLPEVEKTLLHEETDELAALRKMNHWPVETQAISAASWDGTHIRIRLSGSASGIEHARSLIGGDYITATGYWQDLNNFRLDFFQQAGRLWRISLAPMSESFDPESRQLLDWGGAQRWLKSDKAAASIRARAIQLGGHADCFKQDPGVATFHPLEGNVLAVNQRLKTALDPAGILNPGRLHSEF
ncbi:MAG: glycolate oxidase subunit GlcE [Xanthomonadales bacterium]|nr:glycolate oxidase subunit GlcE [Xanthomonadales bacterium]